MAASAKYSFMDDLEEVLEDLNLEDPDASPVTEPPDPVSVQSTQVHNLVTSVLNDLQPSFSFHGAAKDLEKDAVKVSEVSTVLHEQLRRCIVKKSKVSGANREASQKSFFGMLSDGMSGLTALTGNHQLTAWLALQVFNQLIDAEFSNICEAGPGCRTCPISSEESDVAHYIGGCVVSKLQKRKNGSEKEVLCNLISEESPQEGTLLHAKSRGRLTNITTDAKVMFVEIEQVFRDTFADATEKVSEASYQSACYGNPVIQDCFFNSVYQSEATDKDQILSDILHLYFKIRIHHKCKIIIDSVRMRTKKSSKDRALRSKLSK